MLAYARQVLELEKIAKLEGREPLPPREPPQPLEAKAVDSVCLVCERPAVGSCEACRSVSYCSCEHQWVDATWHDHACARLREIREDADFRGRVAGTSLVARLLAARATETARGAPSGWDEYLPEITAPDPAERRVLSDLASRPLTLSRVLPSVSAPGLIEPSTTLRIHVMAASKRELEAPALYALLTGVPPLRIALSFVGPELPNASLEDVGVVRFALRASTYRQALWSELGRPHLLVGFNAGLLIYPSWKETLLELRGSGVPLVITSYRSWEAHAEAELLTSLGAVAVQPPAENPFASLAWRRSSTIANDVSQDNAYVGVWRF